jgi:hypothetical protein
MNLHSPTLQVNEDHYDLWRGNVDLGDGETLNITITHEGIIMDHFIGETGEVSSTVGMTFDEWTDWMRWDAVNAESDAIRSIISENFNQELEGQLSLTEDY